MQRGKPVVLAILDGWGFSKSTTGNPIQQAKTPTLDLITEHYPMTLLQASGLAVGMNWGESGNSEVGHINIGAGRIVYQYRARIQKAIGDKSFFANEALAGAFNHARANQSGVHVIGLLTSGTVHADINHIAGLLEMAKQLNHPNVYLHLFTDGKDSGLKEGASLLKRIQSEIEQLKSGIIATVIGRSAAMDRENRWDRTQSTFELIANAKGEVVEDLPASIEASYEQDITDTKIPPLINKAANYTGIKDNDALIFFNFREDSIRQLFRSFAETNFKSFEAKRFKNLYLASMTQYLEAQTQPIAFAVPEIRNCLAEVVSTSGKRQLHLAETSKYAHVTYFFNGLQNTTFQGEDDVFVDTPSNVIESPRMKAADIAATVDQTLTENKYDLIILNLANADVLAHTGNYNAAIKGIEAVDTALGTIYTTAIAQDAVLLIAADHGNAESMTNKSTGEPESKHNLSPIGFYFVDKNYAFEKDNTRLSQEQSDVSGILGDIAPTILDIMGLPKPPEMSGQSLLPLLGVNPVDAPATEPEL